jgi:hypothetical protein
VGVDLRERLDYYDQLAEPEDVSDTDVNAPRLANQADAALVVRPGGAMDVSAGGLARYEYIWATGGGYLNSGWQYGPEGEVKWRFFPKTALVASYTWNAIDWDDQLIENTGDSWDDPSNPEYIESLEVPDGSLWKGWAGLRGRLTEKLVLELMGGYGAATFDNDVNLEGFPTALLVSTEARYSPVEEHTVYGRYRRDFAASYYANYVAYADVAGGYTGQFVDKVQVNAEAGWISQDYAGSADPCDYGLIRTAGGLGYQAADFMKVGAGVQWWQRASSADSASSCGFNEYDEVRAEATLGFVY